MNILRGRQVDNMAEAILLVIHAGGESGLSPDAVKTFASAIDAVRLKTQAERAITTVVRSGYGHKSSWYGEPWFIPLPQPRYEAQPMPRITFTIQAYLVAVIDVDIRNRLYHATVVGSVDKPVKVILPVAFLQAILDNQTGQFEIAGRDVRSTGWNVPGFKEPVWLPNDFVTGLSSALRLKSVRSWLQDFGRPGEIVLPQVIGSLLGLQSYGTSETMPVGQQPFQAEIVVESLTRMFGSAIAAELYQRAAPHLKSTMTNEQAITLILKEHGGRF